MKIIAYNFGLAIETYKATSLYVIETILSGLEMGMISWVHVITNGNF